MQNSRERHAPSSTDIESLADVARYRLAPLPAADLDAPSISTPHPLVLRGQRVIRRLRTVTPRERILAVVVALMDRVFRHGPFLWSERAWQHSLLRRIRVVPALGLALALLTTTSAFAFVLATKAASRATLPSPKPHGTPVALTGVMLQQQTEVRPTPTPIPYQIGVWLSEYSPPSGGPVQVYVRVTHDTKPAAGVPVSIILGGSTYGPIRTDAYGLATFTAGFVGLPGRPSYLRATATISGQMITTEVAVVPRG